MTNDGTVIMAERQNDPEAYSSKAFIIKGVTIPAGNYKFMCVQQWDDHSWTASESGLQDLVLEVICRD